MYNLNNILPRLKESAGQRLDYYTGNKKQQCSFDQLYTHVQQMAAFLSSRNIKKGDKVGILGKNCYEWIVIDLACLVSGIITIPYDTNKTWVLEELLADFELLALFTNIPEHVAKGGEKIYPFTVVHEPVDSLYTNAWEPAVYEEEDVFTIIATSGTISKSKYIAVRAKSFAHLVTSSQSLFNFKPSDRFMVFLPMHIYLERCYVYAAILIGFDVLLTPLDLVFHSIQNDHPSVIIGIPYFFETFHRKFLQKINANFFYKLVLKSYLGLHSAGLGFLFGNKFGPFVKAWGGNMRYMLTGSAPMSTATLLFYQKMGMTIYEGYGLTEIGGMITLNAPGQVKLGSVGKPFPGKKVTVDDNGHIVVQSEFNANTKYFRSAPEENRDTYLSDGQVATGDLGYFDKEGFLYINGRMKDLIVCSSGKKIHPAPIEEKILDSGLFNNCMVYGDNKPFLVALVVPRDPEADHRVIKESFAKINEGLGADEKVMSFYVHPESFSIENGLLTSSLKVSRSKIINTFSHQLDQLYNS
jgi:long-chain acyl-CoA synthetase